MPTSEEIENIRATAAEAYSINLEKLDQDSVLPPASLPTPTSSSFIPQPFSLEVYQKALSRGSFFNDFLALQDFKFFDISKDTLIRDRLVEQNLEDAVR